MVPEFDIDFIVALFITCANHGETVHEAWKRLSSVPVSNASGQPPQGADAPAPAGQPPQGADADPQQLQGADPQQQPQAAVEQGLQQQQPQVEGQKESEPVVAPDTGST